MQNSRFSSKLLSGTRCQSLDTREWSEAYRCYLRCIVCPSLLINGMILLSISALLFPLVNAEMPPDHPTRELATHFQLDERKLDTISQLLLKIKQTAYHKQFGNRKFGNDAVEDAKKPVSISRQQPDVARELTPFLYEGDILLNEKQAENILDTLESKINNDTKPSARRRKRNFHTDPDAKWTKFPIKYRIHESLVDLVRSSTFYEITQILKAIEFWRSQTCLTFEKIDGLPLEEDYIEFFKGQGCYSMIGRYGGRQGISIGQNCVKLGVIEHEIGHALGMWHEQARPDATAFIEIKTDFILPSYISDFEQQSSDITTLGIPYDLGSVMHYGPAAFSIDKMSRTLQTKDPYFQSTIGQRESLSFYDIKTINKAYCSDRCSGTTVCKHGGYPHPSSCGECICPSGLGGRTCEVNAPPKNAKCGGVITVGDDWKTIASPGFPDPGYSELQNCAWLIKASDASQRIEMMFVEDFSFLCTSTCTDYVELKLREDLANTGFRLCCYDIPKDSFVSESAIALVLFQSQISEDIGFKLQIRQTRAAARTTLAAPVTTSTSTPMHHDSGISWSDWGEWSACSRTCGGCGIKSRIRICPVNQCKGRRQEFGTCNLVACPVYKHCEKQISANRMCNGKICTSVSELPSCDEPQCCPPFFNVNGMCQSDDPLVHDFLDL